MWLAAVTAQRVVRAVAVARCRAPHANLGGRSAGTAAVPELVTLVASAGTGNILPHGAIVPADVNTVG